LEPDPGPTRAGCSLCTEEKDLQYTIENLDKLLVEAAYESGGYRKQSGCPG